MVCKPCTKVIKLKSLPVVILPHYGDTQVPYNTIMLLSTLDPKDSGQVWIPPHSVRSSWPNWTHPGDVRVRQSELSATFLTRHSLSKIAWNNNLAERGNRSMSTGVSQHTFACPCVDICVCVSLHMYECVTLNDQPSWLAQQCRLRAWYSINAVFPLSLTAARPQWVWTTGQRGKLWTSFCLSLQEDIQCPLGSMSLNSNVGQMKLLLIRD